MALYLGNSETQGILLRPVQSRMRKALQETRETLESLRPGEYAAALDKVSAGIERGSSTGS